MIRMPRMGLPATRFVPAATPCIRGPGTASFLSTERPREARMRFTDVRHVPASAGEVWTALHDRQVLHAVIPGCERLSPVGAGRYSATLAARVGRLADTYHGTFTIEDTCPGSELVVAVVGRGRWGPSSWTWACGWTRDPGRGRP